MSAGDVWVTLRGTTYCNNSIVILEDIGEGGDALLCITKLTACCRSSDTGGIRSALGNWFFPNGTRVPSVNNQIQWDFHRSRGHMVVSLHRRRGGEEGIYRCEIPDTMNVTQTRYIGVYSASAGEWSIFLCSYCSAHVAEGCIVEYTFSGFSVNSGKKFLWYQLKIVNLYRCSSCHQDKSEEVGTNTIAIHYCCIFSIRHHGYFFFSFFGRQSTTTEWGMHRRCS